MAGKSLKGGVLMTPEEVSEYLALAKGDVVELMKKNAIKSMEVGGITPLRTTKKYIDEFIEIKIYERNKSLSQISKLEDKLLNAV